MRNGTEIGETRGRGRPPGFDREAALARLAATFRRHGYEGTSLDRLAAATGLARPSLYAAFGDKREMYLTAVANASRGIELSLAKSLALPTLDAALGALFAAVIGSYAEGGDGKLGCLVIGTATAAAPSEPDVRQALDELLTAMDRVLTARCAAAGADCRLAPAAAGALAAAALHSLAVRARAEADLGSMQRLADATIEAICGPAVRRV